MSEENRFDNEGRGIYDNALLEEAAVELRDTIKERLSAGEEVKDIILDLLLETCGISEEDWSLMLDGNIVAFSLEHSHGLSFNASVNACMYTNFLLGYFLAQKLKSDDIDVIPTEWIEEDKEDK